MRIKETGSKVKVILEGPGEAADLPQLISASLASGYTGRRWEIIYPFPEECYTFYACIDYHFDEWCFYAIEDGGYTPEFAKLFGTGVDDATVGAVCRLFRGASETIMFKMHDARLFTEKCDVETI